jgi:hypothetical protein
MKTTIVTTRSFSLFELRRYPWMVEVVRQRPVGILHHTWWRHMWRWTGLRFVSR